MASQPTPLMYPLRNKGLITPSQKKPMVNKPLIRPDFWRGYVRGGRLTSHDEIMSENQKEQDLLWVDRST